jgi:hypothetical protein
VYNQVLRSSNSTPPYRVGSKVFFAASRATQQQLTPRDALRGAIRASASLGMALSSQLRFELPAGIRASAGPYRAAAAPVHGSRRGKPARPAPALCPPLQYDFVFLGLIGRPSPHRRTRVEKSAQDGSAQRVHILRVLPSRRRGRGLRLLLPARSNRGEMRGGRTESVS